jgi:hypothetical protein
MGKIYNVQLKSTDASIVTTASSNLTYNIDWPDLLPENKKFKLTFAFIAGLNFGNNSTFPAIVTNLLGHTYKPATNGFQNAYYLGHLKPIPVILPNTSTLANYVNYTASITDNPPIYLDGRPRNNNLQVHILNGTGTADFHENYLTVTGSGSNFTQAGFIISIGTASVGIITVGTVITPTGQSARTITAFINGTGGAGTYLCNVNQNITTGINYAFTAVTTLRHMAPYILNLSFEEVEEPPL